LFEVEADVRYVITEKTVRGGEAVKQSMTQPKAPLSWHVLRRLASRRNAQSPGLNQPRGAKAALIDPSISIRRTRRGVRVRRPTRPAGLGLHSSEQPRSPGTGRRPGLGCTLREIRPLSNSGGTGCASCCQVLERRKPLLVLRFAGAFLLRFAERTFAG